MRAELTPERGGHGGWRRAAARSLVAIALLLAAVDGTRSLALVQGDVGLHSMAASLASLALAICLARKESPVFFVPVLTVGGLGWMLCVVVNPGQLMPPVATLIARIPAAGGCHVSAYKLDFGVRADSQVLVRRESPGPLGIWYTTDLLQEDGEGARLAPLKDDELGVTITKVYDETVTRVLRTVK
jgi:hypothetical protein